MMVVVFVVVDAGHNLVLQCEPAQERGVEDPTGTVDCCLEHVCEIPEFSLSSP